MKVGDEVYLKHNPSMKGVIHSGSGHLICVDWANGTSDDHWGSSLILASESEKENLKEPKGHPNASILMEIAKEAAVNPEYWKEFQFKKDTNWVDFTSLNSLHTCLINDYQIRRKPRTIRIGNYDVPEPSGAWINPFIKSDGVVVDLKFKTNEEAELMLKALQELLGAKK